MQRLFLLRHGQTNFNLENRIQGGGINAPLNETGIDQGKRFFRAYRNIPFRAIIHTGLQRTKQSVLPFIELGIPSLPVPELNEMNWGIMEGEILAGDSLSEFERLNRIWSEGRVDFAVEKGESPLEVWNRVNQGLNSIYQQFPEGDILICTHGRLLRILLSEVLGYGLKYMNDFKHDNAGLNILRRSSSDSFIAEKLNDLSHLN